MIGKRPLPCPEEATVGLRSEGWVAVSQGRKEGGARVLWAEQTSRERKRGRLAYLLGILNGVNMQNGRGEITEGEVGK